MTLLVWYLITIGNTRDIIYSPPLPTLEDCQRLMNSQPASWVNSKQCVQVRIVK